MFPKWCIVDLANNCFCILSLTRIFRIVILYDTGVGEIKDDDNSKKIVFNEMTNLGMRNKVGLVLQHGKWRLGKLRIKKLWVKENTTRNPLILREKQRKL